MKKILEKVKERMKNKNEEEVEEEYVELDVDNVSEKQEKIYVKPFILEDFSDVKNILNSLREGNTIIIIDMKKLREKDLMELKRAIAKIKKTAETINGDIRGFGEDHLIVVPDYVEILKTQNKKEEKDDSNATYSDYD